MSIYYKDLLEAGRGDTVKVLPEGMDVPVGYSLLDKYASQSPDVVKPRDAAGYYGSADNAYLMGDDYTRVMANKDKWWELDGLKKQAQAAGETSLAAKYQAEQDWLHGENENVRYKYSYSGGADGSGYQNLIGYTAGMDFGGTEPASASGGWQSKYQAEIDSMLNAILGRGPFTYNKDTDPLYQMYKDSYTRGGNRAMQDTLAQMSARTGGLASSYAGSAAQQTYNNYMAELANKVPELYKLAYSMYQDELANDRADLGLLMDLDNTDYGRYRDTVGDSQWQQQFDYNALRDSIADSQWQQQFDYNAMLDDREWNYQLAQDALKNLGTGGVTGTPAGDDGGVMPAIGTYDWYSYVAEHADAAGQSVKNYLTANKKALGISSDDINRLTQEVHNYEPPKNATFVNNMVGGEVLGERGQRIEIDGKLYDLNTVDQMIRRGEVVGVYDEEENTYTLSRVG